MITYFLIAAVVLVFLSWHSQRRGSSLRKHLLMHVIFAAIWPLFLLLWGVLVIATLDEEVT